MLVGVRYYGRKDMRQLFRLFPYMVNASDPRKQRERILINQHNIIQIGMIINL